jgi:hypothetical protein
MFKLDNKEYDETKISAKAKEALQEVVRVSKHMQDLRFAQQGYINILKEELKETLLVRILVQTV